MRDILIEFSITTLVMFAFIAAYIAVSDEPYPYEIICGPAFP